MAGNGDTTGAGTARTVTTARTGSTADAAAAESPAGGAGSQSPARELNERTQYTMWSMFQVTDRTALGLAAGRAASVSGAPAGPADGGDVLADELGGVLGRRRRRAS